MTEALDHLLKHPRIWRATGEAADTTTHRGLTTGFPALDAVLPGNGWSAGALTEVLYDQPGVGELRLVLPALARLSRAGRWVVIIAPPTLPYAPALAAAGVDLRHLLLVHPRNNQERLWAVEQALRSGTCSAVLAWPGQLDNAALRRLQLAAESGDAWGVLFRALQQAAQPSPAALRLTLDQNADGNRLDIFKCRGGSRQQITLNLDRPVPLPSLDASDTDATPTPRQSGGKARASGGTEWHRRSPATVTTLRSHRARGNRARSQLDLPLDGGHR
ncbi:cell division inhibitor SulA/protein ImuA [Alkalispirillum mobile]|uniref:Cell division inhibitor SulA/protein ImuA n=1 Tax=Alkalispirillum mobile TaxID=85925 RepID=A0A498BZE9_9GAMM|nr:translesion DNA synthesis-associated protein ImuA [Alkalispirillum mobile]RLK48832.1 cell division inhibitor SulA/protein ImuA [Alkalispirillum mobile]